MQDDPAVSLRSSSPSKVRFTVTPVAQAPRLGYESLRLLGFTDLPAPEHARESLGRPDLSACPHCGK